MSEPDKISQQTRMRERARSRYHDLLENMQASIKVIPLPGDTNMNGDVFGGWLMSQVDLAGTVPATRISCGKVATVAVQEFTFRAPVNVGDLVCCYTQVTRIGNTSITVKVEVVTEHPNEHPPTHVASSTLVYVAIDEDGEKRRIPKTAA